MMLSFDFVFLICIHAMTMVIVMCTFGVEVQISRGFYSKGMNRKGNVKSGCEDWDVKIKDKDQGRTRYRAGKSNMDIDHEANAIQRNPKIISHSSALVPTPVP